MDAHPFDPDGRGYCCSCAMSAGAEAHIAAQQVVRVVLTLGVDVRLDHEDILRSVLGRYVEDTATEVINAQVLT